MLRARAQPAAASVFLLVPVYCYAHCFTFFFFFAACRFRARNMPLDAYYGAAALLRFHDFVIRHVFHHTLLRHADTLFAAIDTHTYAAMLFCC